MKLDSAEAFHAGMAGFMRYFRAASERLHQPLGDAVAWGSHIEGAIAEALVAKATQQYWPGATKSFQQYRDVGPYEVRQTKYKNGCLLLHPTDPDDAKFVLVVGNFPDMEIVGWIWGKTGKHPDYWTEEQRPCYRVPQTALEPYETLHITQRD